MTLSQIKQILASRNLRLTKSLGQNFLHDANQLQRIVAAAELRAGDRVLEIGPGLGPLTQLLITQPVEVLAIEKDYRLYEYLVEEFSGSKNLTLLNADALDYLREQARDWRDWKLVANLPYSIASTLLVELAQNPHRPQRMVATLQLEVVRRLLAGPGSADYGVLTLLLRLDYDPAGWFKIPAGCFFPAPEVDSGCISLRRRTASLLTEAQRPVFVRLVKLAFSQRRKMMLKLLKQQWPADRLERACAHLQVSSQARAETLGLEQFVRLTQLLTDA